MQLTEERDTAATEALRADRLARVRASLSERGMEALWVEPSVGLFYLTGWKPISLERTCGLVVLAADEPRWMLPLLLADERPGPEGEEFVWSDAEGPADAARWALAGISRLHVQDSLPAGTLHLLRSLRPDRDIDLDPGVIRDLRERKDHAEVALLHRSGRITDDVVGWVGGLDLEGMTERQVATRIQARYLELGLVPTPHPIVATGAGAAMPHYAGGDVAVRLDAPLLLDFGGLVDGYWSDTTRVYFPAEVDAEIEDAYGVVCEAYHAAFAVLQPGVPCEEVDRAARSVIERAGYGDAFLHRTGHGLGLEVHEAPYLRAGNRQPLQVGHVFSVEPGIYVRDRFGVRYENIVYLGEDGVEPMNHSPKKHVFSARQGGVE